MRPKRNISSAVPQGRDGRGQIRGQQQRTVGDVLDGHRDFYGNLLSPTGLNSMAALTGKASLDNRVGKESTTDLIENYSQPTTMLTGGPESATRNIRAKHASGNKSIEDRVA